MFRATIPAGRLFGVPLRLHLSWLLLLLLSVLLAVATTGSAARGFGLWAALAFAVVIREVARVIAALAHSLRVRAMLVFPVGAVLALTSATSQPSPTPPFAISLFGALANFLAALLLLGFSYGLDPHVRLLSQPFIDPAHLLRSAIWLQVALGLVNLLPSGILPMRQWVRGAKSQEEPPSPAPTSAFGGPFRAMMSPVGLLGLLLLTLGIAFLSLPLLLLGGFCLLGAQISNPVAQAEAAASTGHALTVEQVMLTEFTTVAGSDTLRSALAATAHSVQEVFPVLRGDRLVGSITRRALLGRLATEGDSYLQGVMTRTLHCARPGEPLTDALRRSANLGGGDFIPVATEDGAILGLLTPASLEQAVSTARLLTGLDASRNSRESR